jgi:hypothetical protein
LTGSGFQSDVRCPMAIRSHCIGWSKAEPFGAEFAEVEIDSDRLFARGAAIGSAPALYRLDYELETAPGFATVRLAVTARGAGWRRSLDLRRAPSGTWEEIWKEEGVCRALELREATDLDGLAGALDVDLGLSPLLNTPPVLRHGLLRGGDSVDFVMARVSVPDLAVHRSLQRYSFVRTIDDERSVVRFESLGEDDFKADITYDRDGLVLDYPGIGARIR